MLAKIIESFILGFLLISKVNFEDQEEEKTRQNVFESCREEILIERQTAGSDYIVSEFSEDVQTVDLRTCGDRKILTLQVPHVHLDIILTEQQSLQGNFFMIMTCWI